MIKPFQLTPLKTYKNCEGDIYRIMRKSDPNFEGFGEVYISFLNVNSQKGWKLHTKNYTNICVPIGEVKINIYNKSKILQGEFVLGESNYQMLKIPNNYYFGFKNLYDSKSMIINFSEREHDPQEVISIPLSAIKGSDL